MAVLVPGSALLLLLLLLFRYGPLPDTAIMGPRGAEVRKKKMARTSADERTAGKIRSRTSAGNDRRPMRPLSPATASRVDVRSDFSSFSRALPAQRIVGMKTRTLAVPQLSGIFIYLFFLLCIICGSSAILVSVSDTVNGNSTHFPAFNLFGGDP